MAFPYVWAPRVEVPAWWPGGASFPFSLSFESRRKKERPYLDLDLTFRPLRRHSYGVTVENDCHSPRRWSIIGFNRQMHVVVPVVHRPPGRRNGPNHRVVTLVTPAQVQHQSKSNTGNGVYLSNSPFSSWLADRKASWRERRRERNLARDRGVSTDPTRSSSGERQPASSRQSENTGRKEAVSSIVPWETRFNELVQYKARHGDCKPQSQGPLGRWVQKQRGGYKKSKLSQDRIDRLNGIGFDWTPPRGGVPGVPWETRFDELVQYNAKHGDCNISTKQKPLGRWVNDQRLKYKNSKLSQDRIDRLNGIGFDWTPPIGGSRKGRALPSTREQSSSRPRGSSTLVIQWQTMVPWETRFDELVQYKAKHGDCNVHWKQGKLATWVATQRTAYRVGSLAQGRIDRLNSIGFEWAITEQWETRFNELKQYRLRHLGFPSNKTVLGRWVGVQRRAHRAGKMNRERTDKLKEIWFNFNPSLA